MSLFSWSVFLVLSAFSVQTHRACSCPLPASVGGEDLAHITCRSIYPTDAPLPIAASGFFQHTLARSIVNAAGGPVDYIDVMMTAEVAE